jgi:hypothetical protein
MDFSNLSATEIGVLAVAATLISALVAATAALVTALVNGWNARRAAHDAALREYRIRMLQPHIDDVEKRLAALGHATLGAKIYGTVYIGDVKPQNRKISVTPTDELQECAAHFAVWDYICWGLFTQHTGTDPSEDEVSWILEQLQLLALAYREAIENLIFGKTFGWRFTRLMRKNRELRNERLVEICARIGYEPGMRRLKEDKDEKLSVNS